MSITARIAFFRHVGSSVLSQALLSGANFLVSFLLIRRQTESQYGFFVLASVTLLLASSLQSAFFQPPISAGLEGLDAQGRSRLVGDLVRDRRVVVTVLDIGAALLLAAAWSAGAIRGDVAAVGGAGILAALGTLHREFFRGVLFSHHRASDVLVGDAIYVVLLVPGALAATYAPASTVAVVLAIGVAASASGFWLSRALWRHQAWRIAGATSRLRQIFVQGAWSVFGAAMHWSFSQGYTYLVASLVDLRSVAALAATRLLLMPVNLLSTGVTQAMIPLSARWHARWGARVLFDRLLLQCAALAALILGYAGVVWLLRGFIFGELFHKDYPDRDLLLALWCAVFLVMAMRDQLAQIMVVRARQRPLAKLTFVSAGVALATIVVAVGRMGPAGAPVGVLCGELLNATGLLVLGWRETLDEPARRSS